MGGVDEILNGERRLARPSGVGVNSGRHDDNDPSCPLVSMSCGGRMSWLIHDALLVHTK